MKVIDFAQGVRPCLCGNRKLRGVILKYKHLATEEMHMHAIVCSTCTLVGGYRRSIPEAIKAWNEATRTRRGSIEIVSE